MILRTYIKRCTIVLGLLLYSHQLTAQNFTVTSTSDANDAALGDGMCNDGSGNCTLRAAIQESNALGGAHIVTLPAGTYTLTIAGALENAAVSGDLDITCNITIQGVDAQSTLIDGNQLDRVFELMGGSRLTVNNTGILNGRIDQGFGGGILNNGTLAMNYSEMYNCTAKLIDGTTTLSGGFGGGIANFNALTLANTTIRSNNAYGSEGPEGVNGGGGGGSTPGFGGGLYNATGATATIQNATFSGNKAVGGRASRGAINNGFFSAPGSNGGGALGGTPGASGAGVGGNGGAYSGGGGGGSSSSVGGAGGNGGYGAGGGGTGARASGGSGGSLSSGGTGGGGGNRSCCSSSGGGGGGAGFGGGIFNNGGTITIVNTTIAFNEALGGNGRTSIGGYADRGLRGSGNGGGIFNRSGTVTINNTIASNNIADYANGMYNAIGSSQEDISGTINSTSGRNMVYNIGTGVLSGTTTGNINGTDPVLLALGLNGSSMYTHELDCASPAIDAAFDAVAPTLDQRDVARVNYSGSPNLCDIGSFEADCQPLPVELLSFDAIAVDNRYIDLLWETMTELNNDFFTIERSVDGMSWEEVTTVDGAGNSLKPIEYQTVDSNPWNGVSYYRLKQTDFDGQYSYSMVRTVSIKKNSSANVQMLNVYPNPASNFIMVQVYSDDEMKEYELNIYDQQGRMVKQNQKILYSGNNEIKLDVSDQQSGAYFLRIERNGGMIDILRFIIK